MFFSCIESKDKNVISKWVYTEEYSKFNYAVTDEGWVDKFCLKANSFCFKVTINNEIIGICLFIIERNNEFRILINPKFLQKGFGRQITNYAINFAFKELDFKLISLIVRKSHTIAIDMYKKLDFKIVGETEEVFNGQTIEFYKMHLIKGE